MQAQFLTFLHFCVQKTKNASRDPQAGGKVPTSVERRDIAADNSLRLRRCRRYHFVYGNIPAAPRTTL